jgi:hypothetical protein
VACRLGSARCGDKYLKAEVVKEMERFLTPRKHQRRSSTFIRHLKVA